MRNPSNEDWTWRAHYLIPEEGASADQPEYLDEYADDGTDHPFAHIDLARCYAIELIPQRPHLTTHIVRVDPLSGMRPIFFRRRIVPLILLQADDSVIANGQSVSITVLGWQKNVGQDSANVQAFTFYYPDGTTLVSDQRNPPMG